MASRRRRNSSGPAEWITWGIRALIPALVFAAYVAYQDLEQLKVSVAVANAKLDQHAQSLSAIWSRLGQRPPPTTQAGGTGPGDSGQPSE